MSSNLSAPRPGFETACTYDEFMGNTDVVKIRPMDHLARSVTPQDAFDLVSSTAAVAALIEKDSPDIIFFPHRGAGPIEWACEEALSQSGVERPIFVELPLGSNIDVWTGVKQGISIGRKKTVVGEALDRLLEEGQYQPNKSRMMIVDEVQRGGTITEAAAALELAKSTHDDGSEISIVAVQDSRVSKSGVEKNAVFKKLAANEVEGFKTYVVPTTLFTVDRPTYLNAIASDLAGVDHTEFDS